VLHLADPEGCGHGERPVVKLRLGGKDPDLDSLLGKLSERHHGFQRGDSASGDQNPKRHGPILRCAKPGCIGGRADPAAENPQAGSVPARMRGHAARPRLVWVRRGRDHTRDSRGRGVRPPARRASRSYAVMWRSDDRPERAGKLELGADSLRLESGAPRGRLTMETVFYDDVCGVRLVRSQAPQVSSRPALLLDRCARPPLWISSVDAPGSLREVLENLTLAAWGVALR
jgi:hypothetical protein